MRAVTILTRNFIPIIKTATNGSASTATKPKRKPRANKPSGEKNMRFTSIHLKSTNAAAVRIELNVSAAKKRYEK
ncbi:MAG: hypothetical protein IJ736_02815 [Firmicutes bacterium]|nr:hypothetical protein [Bacillota bacterium]